ncbi:hypothetical protein GGX14DRAFT_380272, partial [Mycena pura]
ALAAIKVQLEGFTRQLPEFRERGPTKAAYWKKARQSSHANLLGYVVNKMDHMLPNSMTEERTMSTITRMNSKDRPAQQVQTVIDVTKIRQFNRREAQAEVIFPFFVCFH